MPDDEENIWNLDYRQEDRKFKIIKRKRLDSRCICIVEHVVSNQLVYFFLNCDDCVREKSKLLDSNWTLLTIQETSETMLSLSKEKKKI
jgi:hypothetical protein